MSRVGEVTLTGEIMRGEHFKDSELLDEFGVKKGLSGDLSGTLGDEGKFTGEVGLNVA